MSNTVVRAVPRTVVGAYVKAARLPVDLAGRITRRPEQWPPALAMDALEAKVDTLLGSLIMDERLQERGRLLEAKVAQLRKAGTLRAVAEEGRAEAAAEAEERHRQAEEQRRQAERLAQEREQAIERETQARLQSAEQKAAKKAAAARRIRTVQEKAIERQERAAEKQALDLEAEALGKAKQAVQAEEKAALVEDAIEGSKAARKLP